MLGVETLASCPFGALFGGAHSRRFGREGGNEGNRGGPGDERRLAGALMRDAEDELIELPHPLKAVATATSRL